MKALELESLTLLKGAHDSPDDGMCVMEAVAYIAGEPFSDHPVCASPVISAFLRSYNDSVSDEIRQTLKAYIPRLIGTAGSPELETARALIAADWLVRVNTPAWLRCAGLIAQAEALESLPAIVSMECVPSIMGPLSAARDSAAWDGDAAWAAAGAAAAAAAATWDGDAAAAAAAAAAWDAAAAAAWDAAAAGAALEPTVLKLQATVPALIEAMLAATEVAR